MTHGKATDGHSSKTKASLKRVKKGGIYQNWWVALFIAACCLIYFNSGDKKNEVLATLDSHLQHLKIEKALLLQEKEDLLLQVNSQSDPAWIQLTLKKGLGLVPEGQKKVYFYSDSTDGIAKLHSGPNALF